MKVTMASYHSLSIDHGGPRVQMLQTKKELERLGVQVTLFDSWQTLSTTDCDILHLFAARLGTFQLAQTIHNTGIPLVTSPIFFTRRPAWVIRATLALEHSLKRIRPGIWTDYGFAQQICNWSRSLLPNTDDEASLLVKGMGIARERITVVPNGVDPKFEFGNPSLFKKKYGIEKFILNVGHIGPPRKNVGRLISALRTIDHPAVIIGKVTGTEGKRCLAEAAENKNILIIPGLENDSELLASAYAACDVFVLPSLYETPGIAALEAALAGAKIVITSEGGAREYFGTMARYINPYSVEAIRAGIISALNDTKSGSLKEHVKKEYLWSSVAEKTLAAYERTLRKPST